MKYIASTLLVFASYFILGQNSGWQEFPFEYELRIEEVQPTYITECADFNPLDTGSSYDSFLKTLDYHVQVKLFLPIGTTPDPIAFAKVIRHFENDSTHTYFTNDSNKISIHVTGEDPLILSVPDWYNFKGLNKTYVGCYWNALPTKLTFIYGHNETDDIAHARCKRRLSTKELMQLVRYAQWRLDEDEQPEVLKCRVCILYYP